MPKKYQYCNREFKALVNMSSHKIFGFTSSLKGSYFNRSCTLNSVLPGQNFDKIYHSIAYILDCGFCH